MNENNSIQTPSSNLVAKKANNILISADLINKIETELNLDKIKNKELLLGLKNYKSIQTKAAATTKETIVTEKPSYWSTIVAYKYSFISVLVSLILIIIGAIYYFYYKKKSNDDSEEESDEELLDESN